MSILDRLNQEIIKEYKSGNAQIRVYLQTLKSVILTKSKDKGGDLNEQEEIQTLRSELKKQEEALGQYKKVNRTDLIEKTEKEITILKSYLPGEMGDEEIGSFVRKKLESSDDKSFGNIMKIVMAELKGKADGSKVAQIVKRLTASD